ncbi:hypothetical protein JWJ88_13640 [Paracoccus methylovorus]|uniref:Tail assembly chaperone n=1 Tax=Paracoccus methylovorus TaxID=2812658 RepID=A0ABX7JQ55_9RHOB|nr:hypothetical protein [Paracoccus methylovorus]QRZ15393.1 hypothetical protein JWJ88_13640 [Paracoccus methylovorus]
MQLNDILMDAQGQDTGRDFELVDPVTGQPTGIKLRIAGPDSATQARARLQMVDDLADAADGEGKVPAADRERVRLNTLARCVLGWEISENGEPVPFNHASVVRLLRAALWVQQQVDAFASDRAAFRGQ